MLKRLSIIIQGVGPGQVSGIDNCGTLTIDQVTLSRDAAIRGFFGAIRNRNGGTLTVFQSVAERNVVRHIDGAIQMENTL